MQYSALSSILRSRRIILLLVLLLTTMASTPREPSPQQRSPAIPDYEALAAELEEIRQILRIPGFSAAVVDHHQLVWAQGFGYADVERNIPATPDTPFHLASLTKPIAATLLMQLVEEGRLSLDDPVRQYGIYLENPEVTVRHLLTHTSSGVPGTTHVYDGNRYALLEQVFEQASGESFGARLSRRFIAPLEMTHTAPNPAWYDAGWDGYVAVLGAGPDYRHFPAVYRRLAAPYQLNGTYQNVPGMYPLHFSPAAGLLSSVTDVARFDIALGRDRLLRPETKAEMFTPALNKRGEPLVYGLGWYVQRFQDTDLIWHAGGWQPSVSALLLKVPEEDLTFVILANNYNLTRPFPLATGDVTYSTPAIAFLEHVVYPRRYGAHLPEIDWRAGKDELVSQLNLVREPRARELLEHELWSYRKAFAAGGDLTGAGALLDVHRRAFPEFSDSRANLAATGAAIDPPDVLPPGLLPRHVLLVEQLLAGWVIVTLLSLGILGRQLASHSDLAWFHRLAWTVAGVVFGIIALAAYRLSDGHQGVDQGLGQRALAPALSGTAIKVLAMGAATAAYAHYRPAGSTGAVLAIPAMLLAGWLLLRLPLTAVSSYDIGRWLPAQTLLLELGETLGALLGILPVMLFVTERLLTGVGPDTPLFWAAALVAAPAGALPVYLYNLWLVRRGDAPWPGYRGAQPQESSYQMRFE